MAVPGLKVKKRLALDTNVLFDFAAKHDFALTLLEICQERNYSLQVPPTVVQELTHAALNQGNPLALTALSQLRGWGLEPFDLVSVGHGIAEQFVKRLHERILLPDSESNDGFVLAETSLGEIPVLVTSDRHLLDIDPEELRVCFEDSDLRPVHVVHPRRFLAAFGRR